MVVRAVESTHFLHSYLEVLNHALDYHEKLKIRGAHGVLTVIKIKAILQGLHKL